MLKNNLRYTFGGYYAAHFFIKMYFTEVFIVQMYQKSMILLPLG